MRILGVDPGTYRMGVGIIEKEGSQYKPIFFETLTASQKELPARLHHLYNGLTQVIKVYRPQAMAVENVFFSQNVQTAIKIGEARSLALLAGTQSGLEIREYPPARVKQSVVGNGRASKEQVQNMIKVLLGLKELPPPDSADALALAICFLHTNRSLPVNKVTAPTGDCHSKKKERRAVYAS
jgi:crossover junction endodeoxyribonuclease RuvC